MYHACLPASITRLSVSYPHPRQLLPHKRGKRNIRSLLDMCVCNAMQRNAMRLAGIRSAKTAPLIQPNKRERATKIPARALYQNKAHQAFFFIQPVYTPSNTPVQTILHIPHFFVRRFERTSSMRRRQGAVQYPISPSIH